MNSFEKEIRVRRLLLAYRIFLFEKYKIDINDVGIDIEFCERYKNAINELFKMEVIK